MSGRARRKRHNFPRTTASTTSRGYGTGHKAERKRWEPVLQSGRVACSRCGFPIFHDQAWHLDHRDDKLGWLGPSHASCNLKAAAKRGNQRMRAKKVLERAVDPSPGSVRVALREW